MSTTQRTSRPTQGGFVSIEMIIVLIIIAIGVGLGLAAAAGMFSSSNANEEQRNISVIAANARALKTSSGYGSSGTNLIPSLIAINGVPKNMSVSSGVVYNLAGSVTVSSTGMGFSITTSKLPQDACITLATKIAKNTFEQTKINSGSAITGEVTTAAATQACSSDSNSITWTYSS
ncbi:type 4 pilus major pilin [Pseudomonas aeruginosa]